MGRLGMYPEGEKNPEKIERIIRDIFPAERGSDLCHRVVLFGREICSARSPMCDNCPLSDICNKRKGDLKKSGKM
jgi:endonuclease-3